MPYYSRIILNSFYSRLFPKLFQHNRRMPTVQCDVCFVWVHASCEGFTKDQYKSFSDLSKFFPNVAYCCKLNGCLTCLNQLIAINSKSKPSAEINEVLEDLKKNYSQVNEAITTLSKNIDSLSSNNTELDNKVNTLSKSVQSQPKPPAWEFPATFTPLSVAINIADELSEWKKRKYNVVVHNLPEPSSATNETDIKCFADICHGELGFEVDITKSFRLGQKQNSKPRSSLFKLSSEASRNKLLSYAPKLRFSSTWYQLYIQSDMTPTECEAYRKLQEEIKRHKNLGETNLIIRNGKIIQYVQKSLEQEYRPIIPPLLLKIRILVLKLSHKTLLLSIQIKHPYPRTFSKLLLQLNQMIPTLAIKILYQ